MSARTEVADYLTGELPGWTIYPHGRDLDGLSRPVVMCEQRTVTKSGALWVAGLDLTLIVPGEDPAKVEDDLETALGVLIEALTPLPATDLAATRGTTQNNTLNAYSVTFNVPLRKE